MDKRPTENQHHSGDSGYEKRDVNIRKVFAYAFGSLVVLVFLVILMIDFFVSVREESIHEAVLRPESAALRELRARETEELTTYRVVDSKEGIYRIPIERAMEIMADEAFRQRENRAGSKR